MHVKDDSVPLLRAGLAIYEETMAKILVGLLPLDDLHGWCNMYGRARKDLDPHILPVKHPSCE